MALLKELFAVKEAQISESAGVSSKLSRAFATLEANMERVGAQLKADSALSKAIVEVDGDTKHFASIVKKYDALLNEVLDLVQYTMSSLDPIEEAIGPNDAAFQKVIDFAGKNGYTVKANGARNKFVFKNKELDHTIEADLSVEDGETWVNFDDWLSGTSGNDPAREFLTTFKDAFNDAKEDLAWRKKQDDE
jgi:hypothetical protein